MFRLFSLFVAGTAALHIVEEKRSVTATEKTAAATVHKHAVRKVANLANSLAALGHKKLERQEPAAAEKKEHPIDNEGYEADWGTEFRDAPYPPEAEGKQQHPEYDSTVGAKLRAEIGGSWWWWFFAVVVLVAVGGGLYYKKQSA